MRFVLRAGLAMALSSVVSCTSDGGLHTVTASSEDMVSVGDMAPDAVAADLSPITYDAAGTGGVDLLGSPVDMSPVAPPADLADPPAPDLAQLARCGLKGGPCCASNICSDGSVCMTNASGSLCIDAASCGSFRGQCCDAAGNPGVTSIAGYCESPFSCRAGSCLP